MHRICEAVPEEDFRLHLLYSDGTAVVVDFESVIRSGGVFTPLSDPAFFARVSVDERGRYITWPGEIDFCADSLRENVHA